MPRFCYLLQSRKNGRTEASNFRMLYMQFGELVLVIFNEFVSQFAKLNVVIFNNLTSVRWTDPRINETPLTPQHSLFRVERNFLLINDVRGTLNRRQLCDRCVIYSLAWHRTRCWIRCCAEVLNDDDVGLSALDGFTSVDSGETDVDAKWPFRIVTWLSSCRSVSICINQLSSCPYLQRQKTGIGTCRLSRQ